MLLMNVKDNNKEITKRTNKNKLVLRGNLFCQQQRIYLIYAQESTKKIEVQQNAQSFL